jgi:hypothetical protein
MRAPRCRGVGGDLQQGFGGGAEENAINDPLVLERQRRDQLGHGEDHMEVLETSAGLKTTGSLSSRRGYGIHSIIQSRWRM